MKANIVRNEGSIDEWAAIVRCNKKHRYEYCEEDKRNKYVMYYPTIDNLTELLNNESVHLNKYWIDTQVNNLKNYLQLSQYVVQEDKKSPMYVLCSTVYQPNCNKHIKKYYLEDNDSNIYTYEYSKSVKHTLKIDWVDWIAHKNFYDENKVALDQLVKEAKKAHTKNMVKKALRDIKNTSDNIENSHNNIIKARLTLDKDIKKWELNKSRFDKVYAYLFPKGETDYHNTGVRMSYQFNQLKPKDVLDIA